MPREPNAVAYIEALVNSETKERRLVYQIGWLVFVVKVWDYGGPSPTLKIFQGLDNYEVVKAHWKTQESYPKLTRQWHQDDRLARHYIREVAKVFTSFLESSDVDSSTGWRK